MEFFEFDVEYPPFLAHRNLQTAGQKSPGER